MSLKTDLSTVLDRLNGLRSPLTRFALRAAQTRNAAEIPEQYLEAMNDLLDAIELVQSCGSDDVLILEAAEEIQQNREARNA